jgi:hypothetical protein
VIHDALRFLAELVLAIIALGAGLGSLWIASKLAPPAIEFLARIGL